MKKFLPLLLLLIGSSSALYAAGAGGVNLSTDPRVLLRTTNTWTAAQTFSSITVIGNESIGGNLTINGTCTGCGGGGGGGSGGAFIFNGSQNVAVTTLNPVGATVTNSGTGSSSFTWTPQILSTYTALIQALNIATNAVTSADIFGRTYYLHHESTGPSSVYFQIASTPDVGAEISKTQAVNSVSGLVKISSFVTLNNDPGTNKIPAGGWDFTTWFQADNVLSLDNLVISIATCDFDGSNPSEIVSSTSPNIINLGVNRYDTTVIQNQDLYISTSQRIIATYSARTTSVGSVNFTLYYAGTSRTTHFDAPLADVYKFTQLQDVPQTYFGQNNKYLALNNDATALVFVSSNTDRLNSLAGAGVNGSTSVVTLTWGGSVFQSTIDVCGLPGMCYSMGADSATITDITAIGIAGSTVGWTRLDLAFSTGGINGLPTSYRFPPIILSTASSLGTSSWSGVISSGVPVNAFETFGVQVSSIAPSGIATTGLKLRIGLATRSTRY